MAVGLSGVGLDGLAGLAGDAIMSNSRCTDLVGVLGGVCAAADTPLALARR